METNTNRWFKAKAYGWGWVPISWQGWVLMLLYVLDLIQIARNLDAKTHSVSDFLINFALHFIVITVFFLVICYTKGEHPHWRWGNK
ncbi:MAG: putative rane protein [Parcubacteria group bacterium]|nr:putative rane protein [Parcubacteria group bacterium]